VRVGPALAVLVVMLASAQCLHAAPLEAIRDILRRHLLNPPDEAALAGLSEGDLQGGLRGIDPYARIIAGSEYRAPVGEGSWIGIGAGLAMREGVPVLHVYRGGGAERAGVPDRVRLLEIDGASVRGLDAEAIASRLRGEEGSTVRLRVALPGGGEKPFTVRREAFSPLDVELVPPGSQRVVRVRDFAGGLTRPAMRATLDFLARTTGADQSAPLIIDLRDAPGGDLYEAFDLAGLFLPAGTLLGTIRGRDGYVMEIRSPGGDKYPMPITLLVGPETASSAEIFAGILRQHGRARLVGQTTYGKCSSQTDARLSDGSVLRYTNREVMFPRGDTCTGQGLTPDLAVGDDELDMLSRLVKRAQSLYE
jgi:carboxyl-terminal processing protease